MSVKQILESVASDELSIDAASVLLHKLIHLKEEKHVTYKLSEKGGISFYGIRKFPITLYLDELNKICEISSTTEFREFVDQNKNKFSDKSNHSK